MYGLDLRECFQTMPAADLVDLLAGLDYWGPHEENTALLLEAERYKLDLSWADRTIDPNDPEVKAARRASEHVKPPTRPMIPPIANRPAEIADLRIQQYLDQLTAYRASGREKVLVPLDEFDAMLDPE